MASILNRIQFHFWKLFKPVMVGKYKRFDGIRLPNTRIGNTTTVVGRENFKISDNVFIGQYNFIDASNGLTIETGCQITNYVSILTHSSHQSIRLYGHHYNQVGKMKAYQEGEVKIGQFSFVGPHTVIMPNSRIGKGCIVAAFSYVKGDFPDFSIIGGNPAKVIGDTREMDRHFLESDPELKRYYEEWALQPN